MAFKLFWDDPNLAEEGHKVYRDTSPMNPLALPTEIATLGPNVVEYEDDDDTIVDSTTYYYRVSAYVTGTEKVSDEITLSADSSSPIVGDANFYYKMDDITGTTLADSLGKSDGTLVNGPTQVTFGVTGYALQFDGIDQRVILNNPKLSTDSFTNLSAGCWFKTSAGGDMIFMSYDRSDFYRLGLGGDSAGFDSGKPGVSISGVGQDVFDMSGLTEDLRDDQWHLIIFTFDNGVLTLYLDGFVEQAYDTGYSAIGNGNSSSGQTRYGYLGVGSEASTPGGTTGPDYFYEGLMTKAFEMYRTMSAAEVAHMYNRGPEA